MSAERVLRLTGGAAAAATLAVLVALFATAGSLVQDSTGLGAHGTAAVAVHVTSGIAAVALVARAVLAGTGGWLAGLAVVVFAGSFGQAALGSGATVAIHVVCALLLAMASTWLAARLLAPRPRQAA